eukprot:CAMPEP_0197178312 /NCGR_PEP_ID=MMETSP1423-20130617/3624_1 /TAXON_ID=476441 /ORGANISM="Pseudo-nitzschia heimii, Strain UNC1101" /LENGTH=381 /DNA_ID=CAMNT_0042628021 /DNA_START=157 /DNA_END=1302 /DNA_ORIENTATION=-
MDDSTMNKLYGWKGRVHKAIKVFEQCKMEYVRVCTLPAPRDTLKGTTYNHDADIALTWCLLESSRKVVDATCDGFIASIKSSFNAYQKEQERGIVVAPRAQTPLTMMTTPTNADETRSNPPNLTIWIEGVVENTINSHVKFIEQWRGIISDAQKEAAVWKSEHEQYLEKLCEIRQVRNDSDNISESSDDESEYDSDEDDDSDDEDDDDDPEADGQNGDTETDIEKDDGAVQKKDTKSQLELIRMGIRVDEHAERLFQLGTYVSAGKVLISSLKIASKIGTIEKAAQEAGTACIMGLTQRNLRDREVFLGNGSSAINSNLSNIETGMGRHNNNHDTATIDYDRLESAIVAEWKNETDATKVNAVYSWYRMYHGALTPDLKLL